MVKNWNEKGTLREWVFSIADNCESVIESCKFKGSILAPCCDKFKPIYSERGFCHSFNARHYGTNISEVKSKSFNTIAETDTSWALEMRLKKQSKVYMHSIDEVFSYDFRHQFTWEYSQSIDILISMKETYTTKDVEELSIAQRKCIFPDSSDYKITYYNNDKYSLSACMKECRMKIAIDKCKCIPPFYAPVNMGNYKHCELKDLSCLSRYAGNITNIMKCSKCELSCFNIVYDIEKISLTVKNNSAEARINIEFLTWPIIRYKREILFGYVDLLVSFGGIAGLFLGFSLLSGIELFYYFTVRACCMMYKNREKLYEMREEEDSRPPTNYDMSLRTKFKSLKQQNMTDIQMVLPVASAYNRSSYSSSVSNDRFIVNERPLAIPSMNIKTRQDSNIIQPAIVKIFKINKHLLNNRVKRSMNELQSNYGDKQASSSTQAVIPTTKFQRFSNATHTTKIKPLDANYKRQRLRIFDEEGKDEINLVYHGYLP
ncbi:hypothetical protein PVAND_012119 [Polypedilum vanderplanki]|nr:hypothetical protein PVAND_012119 [Polypedilum vanderplanki]